MGNGNLSTQGSLQEGNHPKTNVLDGPRLSDIPIAKHNLPEEGSQHSAESHGTRIGSDGYSDEEGSESFGNPNSKGDSLPLSDHCVSPGSSSKFWQDPDLHKFSCEAEL